MPKWRPAAISDRKKITAFIANNNPRAAMALVDMIIQKVAQLDQHPLQGRAGRVKGTRELVVHPNYIVIYRVVRNGVEVLRIKHVAQRWPDLDSI